MWFKNLRLYRLTQPLGFTPEELEQKLSDLRFQPCSGFDKSSLGWVSPLGREGQMLTHVVGSYIMVCAQEQERLLPASVIRDATEAKVAELEERQARKIYRKEKRQIQEDVFASLLPRAFVRNQQFFAYLAPQEGMLVMNCTSAPKAEALLNLLRDSVGSLPVALPEVKRSPGDVMTRWLRERKAPGRFRIEHDCELYNPLDSANIIRCKGQDLLADELKAMLLHDKRVKALGVRWNDLLSCVVHDDLTIHRLRFEGIREEVAEHEVESEAQKFDQEFALMSMELSGFLRDLFQVFGGLRGET